VLAEPDPPVPVAESDTVVLWFAMLYGTVKLTVTFVNRPLVEDGEAAQLEKPPHDGESEVPWS
jgi:hypothetical protein